MPATVKEHPKFSDAQDRVVELRQRKKELQEELRVARSADPDVDDLAAEYEGELDRDTRSPSEIQEELRVVTAAIRKARSARQSAKTEAKADVLDDLRPRYREAIGRLAHHVRELLHEAERGEGRIREEAKERGLTPVAMPNEFHPLPERQLRAWLEDAEERFDL